jgi:hypothetical protein
MIMARGSHGDRERAALNPNLQGLLNSDTIRLRHPSWMPNHLDRN